MLLGLLLIVLVAAFLVIAFAVGIYNRLVTLRNRTKNSYAQIDVQLKRRHDLIPNLVETAKAYLKHERTTLEAVIASRNNAVAALKSANPTDSNTIRNLTGAEGQLNQALSRLFAVVESYPDLKGDKTMTQLSEELTSTENKVSFARQAYNDAVMEYNTSREVFPNSLIANPFHFKAAELFEITDAQEKAVPKVSFS